jgi:hypothetical protein
VLAFSFTVQRKFVTKTKWKFVSLGYETHITNWLYIMVMYINFYRFWKFKNFGSKSKCVSLLFYRKTQVCDKNWQKLHISWSWILYSRLVIHNGYVHKFFMYFKNIQILAKNPNVLEFSFTGKHQLLVKTDRNFVSLGR